ncbi:MAG: aldolase/citrate lyase family protein [Minwuia sp.]|nr:aldolase/citrate lyase family protein [Minwuia sp.]
MIRLMLIPETIEMARDALNAGVDRLFLDLERAGKQQRQGTGTWISAQNLDDVRRYRDAFPDADMIVRTDPWSALEISDLEQVIAIAPSQIMLPMISGFADVAAMRDAIAGRMPLLPLIETVASADLLAEIVALDGVDEIDIGLNDLHLDRGDSFMFQPLADGTVARLAAIALAAGVPFGFGGIARLGHGDLDAELIIAEHVRLGSTSVMLSRKFKDRATGPFDWSGEIGRIREAEKRFARRSEAEAEADRQRLVATVDQIVRRKTADQKQGPR